MKVLTESERLGIAMSLLTDYELNIFAQICKKRELGCPDGLCEACLVVECAYPDPSDPKANGFYNIPAECEDSECKDCCVVDTERRKIDCPYV